jgi:hypothetical protein
VKKIVACSVSSLLVIAGAAQVALADPNNPTDNDKAAARPLAIEGLRLAQAGNCKEAVDKLERGESLVHAPTTSVPLAECYIQLGRLIAGTELLNRVINEATPSSAPASWAESKQQARTVLAAAIPRLGKLRIHVDVPPGTRANPEVTVDGQPIPVVLLDNDRPTDPGQHHVTARQVGLGNAEADVMLAEGQVKPVALRLGTAPGAVAVAPGAASDPYGQSAAGAPPPVAGVPDPYGPGAAPPPSIDSGAPWMAAEFGARLAFGIPLGNVSGGNGDELDHSFSNAVVPLWLDAGFRFASNWYVGGSFSYGISSVSNQAFAGSCQNPGVGCSGSDIRFGVNGQYHVIPDGRFDPWFGLGFGYEWASLTGTLDAAHSNTGAAVTNSSGSSGWEFVNFQGGLDFRLLNGTLGIGPFLTFAVSQYSSKSTPSDNNGGTTGSSISNQALHEWFLFGVRGDYDLKIQ